MWNYAQNLFSLPQNVSAACVIENYCVCAGQDGHESRRNRAYCAGSRGGVRDAKYRTGPRMAILVEMRIYAGPIACTTSEDDIRALSHGD